MCTQADVRRDHEPTCPPVRDKNILFCCRKDFDSKIFYTSNGDCLTLCVRFARTPLSYTPPAHHILTGQHCPAHCGGGGDHLDHPFGSVRSAADRIGR